MSAQSHRDGYLPFWRRFREINLATLERAAGTPLSYATAELICQALFQFHGESEHTSRLSNTKLRRDELKNVTTHCDRAADALRLLEPGAAAELSQDFRDFRAENCRSRASHAATWAEEMAKLLAQISTKATQQLLDVKPRERKKSDDAKRLIERLEDAMKQTSGYSGTAYMGAVSRKMDGDFADFLRAVWKLLPTQGRPTSANAFAEYARRKEEDCG